MEIWASLLLFAALSAVLTLVGARLWMRPNAAIDRVTNAALDAAPVASTHPALLFREMVRRLGTVLPSSPRDVSAIERRMIRAGYRGAGAVKTFYGAKVGLAVLLPALTALLFAGAEGASENLPLMLGIAAAAGFIGPNRFLDFRARRRQKMIRRGLPNALDLLVVCVESGLGLDQAIMQVAKELEHAHPEISQEFALVNLELKAGKRRVEALRNLAERTAVDDLKKLVAVLIQADRFGTGIAQSLRTHSEYMRVQSRQTAEEKAAKLGVKLVFPIFFCILPSLFVVTVGPVIVRISRELLPMMRNM
jgi:tight adherence protein C